MEEQLPTTLTDKPKVLLVDDEESILNSLRRLLRGQPYEVLLATSGAQALEIMAQQPIDLVMTDARMPNMDGATLLAHIHQRYPDTTRIMLTGYADPSAIIKAINEGQIHRYISKPWHDEEMLLTLRQSLAYQHSERERLRLVQQTWDQNEQLKLLNATLEKHVAARTAELQQTADMLDLAYEELKHSYVTGTEVFSLLANLRLPPAKQTNRQIIELVRVYCKLHGLDEGTSRDLTMAAALYNIGKLSWTDSMMTAPADLLHHSDRERYRGYPKQSESLLMTLEPMKDAARLILHHQERWDGSGFPDRLKGEAIPFGSRLLKLAVDFIELQRGLILERQMNSDEALVYIRNYAGRLYDPGTGGGFHPGLCRVPERCLAGRSVGQGADHPGSGGGHDPGAQSQCRQRHAAAQCRQGVEWAAGGEVDRLRSHGRREVQHFCEGAGEVNGAILEAS